MKKLFFFLIIVLAAGYYCWPYLATSQVRDAINSTDESGLDKTADWGSMRLSLKDQVKPLVDDALRKRFAANLPQVTKALGSEELLNKVIEEEVSAKGLIRNTKERMEFGDARQLGIDSRSWAGWSGFDMKLSGSEASYHFDFKGTDGWKMVSVKLGPKDGDVYVAKFNEAVAERIKKLQAAAGSGSAPGTPYVPGVTQPPKSGSWLKDYQNPLDKKPVSNTGSGRH
jgi:hypothetical protein